jgi:type I restriction enzyme S subunit
VLLQKGDIVLEKSGGSPNQPVGRVVYFDSKDNFGYVNFLQKLVVNPKYDSRYVFYALKQYYESKKVLRYQQQTTGIINFQLNDFLKTAKIRVPDSLQEQQSISSILNNCDNQIQLLIKKKLLLEKQKKGLMQQLLTGKTRVS